MNLNKLGSEATASVRQIQSAVTNAVEHIKPKSTIAKNNLVRTPEADEYIRIGLKIDGGSGIFEKYNDKKQLVSIIEKTSRNEYSTELEKIFDYSTGKRRLVRIDFRTSRPEAPAALTRAVINPETRLCTGLEHYGRDGKLIAKVSGIDSEGYATYAEWDYGRYIAKYDESTNRSLFIDNLPSPIFHIADYTLKGKINLFMLNDRFPIISISPFELGMGYGGDTAILNFLRKEHW